MKNNINIVFTIYLIFIIIIYFEIFTYQSLWFPYTITPVNLKPNLGLYIFIILYFAFLNLFVFLFSKKYYLRMNNKNHINKIRGMDTKFKKTNQLLTNTKENVFKEEIAVLLGVNEEEKERYLRKNSLLQNVLVVGAIGSGKTSSVMYNLTKQLIEYKSENKIMKQGMLILDVKGNYHEYVEKVAKDCGREEDLIFISMEGDIYYNPLDKKDLEARVISMRLKEILLLFSKNNTESYWIDKAEELISEVIKYVRLYNQEYVTFVEIHKVINDFEYYNSKKSIIKKKLKEKYYTEEQIFNLNTSIDYIEKEFMKLDERTKGIIKSEISRITNLFISNYKINKMFCSEEEEINFRGFEEVVNEGKIVVLNMNIAKYGEISRVIATYLKQDYQSTILQRTSSEKEVKINRQRLCAFIVDEYQDYVTNSDSAFYSKSRESKSINIVSTQSYTSLKNVLSKESETEILLQSFINKIWLKTYDTYTLDMAIKLIGKEEKVKENKTFSENAKNTHYNFVSQKFINDDFTLSESISKYKVKEEKFDYPDFTQGLNTFEAICLYSEDGKSQKVEKLKMIPYFLT